MVFVPFTGVDGSFDTLAIILISNEDVDSYSSLLKCFRKSIFCALGVLVTHQDSATKAVIARIFPESTHHFCMWHIAEKMKASWYCLM
ncbi:hypothetical protein QQ045_015919 [Rhodiola kirilowii]